MNETLTPAQLHREQLSKIPEKAVLAAGLRTFALHGWEMQRINSGMIKSFRADGTRDKIFLGKKGTLDLIGWSPWGAHVEAEAKRPDGSRKLTPAQLVRMRRIRGTLHGVAVVFGSSDELTLAMLVTEVEHFVRDHAEFPIEPSLFELRRNELLAIESKYLPKGEERI